MSKGNIVYFDKGLDYTGIYTGKKSSNCMIKFMISLCENWMSKKDKNRIINNGYTELYDMHTDVLMICILRF